MSGDAKREAELPIGDVTDDEAEKLAEEAERWLEQEEKASASERGGKTAEGEDAEPPLDEVEVRDLLRQALRPPPGSIAPSLLGGVQKKLRTRSQGKFYSDGWSTARSPRSTYLVTSLVMLLLVAFVFLVLVPWGGGALP